MINLTGKSSDFVNIALSAAKKGNLVEAKEILRIRPDWLHHVGPHGRTMLWEAAYQGRTEIVAHLLELGANPHVWACYFKPILVEVSAYVAAKWKRRTETVQLLCEIYEPINVFSAAFLGESERVEQLINEDRNVVNQERPQQDRESGFTALHYAISKSYYKILKLLLDRGANPNPYAHWLVKFAIWRSDLEVIQVVLESGIFPKQLRWKPAFATNLELRGLLQRFGISIDPNASEHGWPPLVYESRGDRGGNVKVIKKLLNQGAHVSIRNHKGETALHCASKAGFVAVIELLLSFGANIEIFDNKGLTPLQHALRSTIKSRSKTASVIQSLLRHGASTSNLSERDRRMCEGEPNQEPL